MAELLDHEIGVSCSNCSGEGVGCELPQVPEITEGCPTMQVIKLGSAIEVVDEGSIQPPELPYDWEESNIAA